MLRLLFFVVVLGLAAAGGAYLWFEQQVENAGPATTPTRVLVARGSGLSTVAQQLQTAGIVEQARVFQAYATMEGKEGAIQAGEYLFPPRQTMQQVLDRMVQGDTLVHQLVFPEGMTSHAILEQLKGAPDLTGSVPAELPEGSLMPAAYDFTYGEKRSAVIARMQKAMKDALAEAWAARDANLPIKTPEEMVILASIVEKETGLDGERGKVAGVFINRLNKGMKLQSDPTTIYAVTQGKGTLGRGLRKSELAKKHDYNTYHIKGLPPGPIANPGRDALMAVAKPEATKALYFVADGTGGHAFANTLSGHLKNVKNWRKIERQRKAAQ